MAGDGFKISEAYVLVKAEKDSASAERVAKEISDEKVAVDVESNADMTSAVRAGEEIGAGVKRGIGNVSPGRSILDDINSIRTESNATGRRTGEQVSAGYLSAISGMADRGFGRTVGEKLVDDIDAGARGRLGAFTTSFTNSIRSSFGRSGIGRTLASALVRDLGSALGSVEPIHFSPFLIAAGDIGSDALMAAVSLVGQLGAGVTSLGAAAATAGSLLATLPTAILAGGLVAETTKLAFGGLSKAIKDSAAGSKNAGKELAALPAPARAFANEVVSLKPKLTDLRNVAAAGIFPGLTEALKANLGLFPEVRGVIAETAKTIGDLARQVGLLFAGPLKGDLQAVLHTAADITQIFAGNVQGLVITFAEAARVGAPFAKLLAGDISNALKNATAAATTWIGEGGLAAALSQGRYAAGLLAKILGNVVAGIVNIGRAAVPAGNLLLAALSRSTAKFRELTGSADGQNKLREYFLQSVPIIRAFGNLVTAVVSGFIQFGNLPGNENLLNQIRTQLLPAVERLFTLLSQSGFVEQAVGLLTNLVNTLALVAVHGDGAAGIMATFNEALKVLDKLLQLPGAGPLISILTYAIGVGAALKTITGLGKGVADSLLFLDPLAGKLKSVASDVAGLGGGGASKGTTVLGKGAEAEKSTAESGAKAGQGFIGGLFTALGGLAGKIGPFILGIFARIPFAGAIAAAIGRGSLAGPIGIIISLVVTLVGLLAFHFRAGIGHFFTETLPRFFTQQIPAAFSSVAGTIGKAFASAWSDAVSFVTTTIPRELGRFASAIIGAAGQMVGAGVSLLEGLARGIEAGFAAVSNFFALLPTRILFGLGWIAGFLVIHGIHLLEGLWNGITSAWDAGFHFFTELPGNIASFFATAGTWILDKGSAILSGLWDGIKTVWNNEVHFWTDLPGVIASFFITAATWLISHGQAVLSGLWNGLRAGWSAGVEFFIGLPGAIKSFFTGSPGWLVEHGKQVISGLASGLSAAWGAVASFCSSVRTKVIDAVGNAGSWLLEAGKDVLRGLINGIGSMWGSVIGKMQSLGSSIISGFRSAITSHSPSRAFHDAGLDVMRGYMNGVDALTDPAIQQMTNLGGMLTKAFDPEAFGLGAISGGSAGPLTSAASRASIALSGAAASEGSGKVVSIQGDLVLQINGTWNFANPSDRRKVLVEIRDGLVGIEAERK